MSPFEYYLRTGRRIAPAAAATETKFNPWHDPEDGRFTFAGQGRYFPGPSQTLARNGNAGFRGRDGSFGGGGAGGSWDPAPQPAKRPKVRHPDPKPAKPTVSLRHSGPVQDQHLTVPANGYDFSIDAHARPRRISGELRLQSQPRSRRAQADAGKPDRRATDDGGHYIAARFNGPREWFNHFAQDANFNRGAYRAIEDEWAKAIRSGQRVFVDIVPHYHGTSMRPYELVVAWYVDGQRTFQTFPNESTRPRDGD